MNFRLDGGYRECGRWKDRGSGDDQHDSERGICGHYLPDHIQVDQRQMVPAADDQCLLGRDGVCLCGLQQERTLVDCFHGLWSWNYISSIEQTNAMVREKKAELRHDLPCRLEIDDPLDAFAVHAGGGFWGLISATIISHDGIVYAISDCVNRIHCKKSISQAFAVSFHGVYIINKNISNASGCPFVRVSHNHKTIKRPFQGRFE